MTANAPDDALIAEIDRQFSTEPLGPTDYAACLGLMMRARERIATLESALAASQATIRQAQEDAERYRWLRDPFKHGSPWLVVKRINDQATMGGVVLDDAIDQALSAPHAEDRHE